MDAGTHLVYAVPGVTSSPMAACALVFQRHSTYNSVRPASKGVTQRLDLPDLPLSGNTSDSIYFQLTVL